MKRGGELLKALNLMELISSSLGHCLEGFKDHLPEFFISERGKLFSNKGAVFFSFAQLSLLKFLLSCWLLGRVQGV